MKRNKRKSGRPIGIRVFRCGSRLKAVVFLDSPGIDQTRRYWVKPASFTRICQLALDLGEPSGQFAGALPVIFWRDWTPNGWQRSEQTYKHDALTGERVVPCHACGTYPHRDNCPLMAVSGPDIDWR